MNNEGSNEDQCDISQVCEREMQSMSPEDEEDVDQGNDCKKSFIEDIAIIEESNNTQDEKNGYSSTASSSNNSKDLHRNDMIEETSFNDVRSPEDTKLAALEELGSHLRTTMVHDKDTKQINLSVADLKNPAATSCKECRENPRLFSNQNQSTKLCKTAIAALFTLAILNTMAITMIYLQVNHVPPKDASSFHQNESYSFGGITMLQKADPFQTTAKEELEILRKSVDLISVTCYKLSAEMRNSTIKLHEQLQSVKNGDEELLASTLMRLSAVENVQNTSTKEFESFSNKSLLIAENLANLKTLTERIILNSSEQTRTLDALKADLQNIIKNLLKYSNSSRATQMYLKTLKDNFTVNNKNLTERFEVLLDVLTDLNITFQLAKTSLNVKATALQIKSELNMNELNSTMLTLKTQLVNLNNVVNKNSENHATDYAKINTVVSQSYENTSIKCHNLEGQLSNLRLDLKAVKDEAVSYQLRLSELSASLENVTVYMTSRMEVTEQNLKQLTDNLNQTRSTCETDLESMRLSLENNQQDIERNLSSFEYRIFNLSADMRENALNTKFTLVNITSFVNSLQTNIVKLTENNGISKNNSADFNFRLAQLSNDVQTYANSTTRHINQLVNQSSYLVSSLESVKSCLMNYEVELANVSGRQFAMRRLVDNSQEAFANLTNAVTQVHIETNAVKLQLTTLSSTSSELALNTSRLFSKVEQNLTSVSNLVLSVERSSDILNNTCRAAKNSLGSVVSSLSSNISMLEQTVQSFMRTNVNLLESQPSQACANWISQPVLQQCALLRLCENCQVSNVKFRGNSCYYFSRTAYNWSQAQEICSCLNLNSSLVVIEDALENDYVADIATQLSMSYTWTGLSFMPQGPASCSNDLAQYNWRWVGTSKTASSYSNWKTGEPNGCSSTSDVAENCVEFKRQWNDLNCSNRREFICEIVLS